MKSALIIKNSKALFNYAILDTFECGIVLLGSEVNPMKNSNCNFTNSYITIDNNVVVLRNFHISKNKFSVIEYNSTRNRILLMKKREIFILKQKINEKHLTLIPLEVYIKNNKIKIKIALAKGKLLHNKKQDLKEKDILREMSKDIKKYKDFLNNE